MTLSVSGDVRYKVLWAMTPVPAATVWRSGCRPECAADGQQRRHREQQHTISDALENITLNLNDVTTGTRR